MTDHLVRAQLLLQRSGGDVLAAGGDDDLLGASGDPQITVGVEFTEIAGLEPTVVESIAGGVRVLPVLLEHDRTAQFDLTVLGDPDRVAGDRSTDGADALHARTVHRDRRAGLGQAVALVRGHPDAAVEVGERLPQCATAGDRDRAASAHRFAHLGVDELVEQPVLRAQPDRRFRGVVQTRVALALAPLDRDPFGATEDLGLDRSAGESLRADAAVHLLQHPRHAQDHFGPEGTELVHDRLEIAPEPDRGATLVGRVGHCPRQHVRERQEHQGALAESGDRLADRVGEYTARLGEQVAVGDHATLRASGGAGGVDDRGG